LGDPRPLARQNQIRTAWIAFARNIYSLQEIQSILRNSDAFVKRLRWVVDVGVVEAALLLFAASPTMSCINASSPVKLHQRDFKPLGNPFGPQEPSTFASFDSSHLVFSFPRNAIASTSSTIPAPPGNENRSKPAPKRGRDVFESESATVVTAVDQFRGVKRRALAVVVENQWFVDFLSLYSI
jgi:hypothetical protein